MNLETFESLYLRPQIQCVSLSLQLGWISPSTGDWKRSVASVRGRSEFRTGCDSFLRQRDASEPRRFNRSHVSVTGIESSAGERERQSPSEPDVIDTPVNHTFPVHSHRLLAEALIVFYKANALSHHTNLHF